MNSGNKLDNLVTPFILVYNACHLNNLILSRKSLASVVEELEKVLEFNNLLVSLKSHSEADQFARGVGPISLIGEDAFDLLFSE